MIEGGCHCGAVRIQVDEAPATLTECNCSICRRVGGLWFYPHPRQVRIDGEAATVTYVQGDRTLALHHCGTCGCTTHWRSLEAGGGDRMGVNARMMAPEVVAAAKVRRLDGADTWTYFDEG